jgi:uncharacterized membrane protein YbaN (DUF454 family)
VKIREWIFIIVGGLFVIGGVLTFWLPLPIGLPMLMIGTPVLFRYSPRARAWITRILRNHPRMLRLLGGGQKD